MYEFDCARCGIHVTQFGFSTPPAPPLYCLQCAFIEGVMDPDDKEAMARFLDRREEGKPDAQSDP